MIIKAIITIVLYLAISFLLAWMVGKFLNGVDIDASNSFDNYIKTKHEEEERRDGGLPGAGTPAAA